MPKDKATYEVVLEKHQMAFLEEMAGKYGLEDASKAIRVLVNFAIDEEGERERVFGEVRCLDCGG
ncbi:MAG: hypothetical protein A3F84_26690 [Candidatus Handelsmanbacteria bacterium RIFCSPLOWO2_12_FULL_64_10]|uniref:CopG family transcriptional regulator n=1 Tax=Handelsmanbacteria sp. (strain RIFCSPLOWO2_12_FULL_64_10) TaxID=1817868 RepID=A0A1F6CQI0_HANXR|nr:MAG: hypothetical protein A3F84_26690 [Candidatus Handelsmanbacteria bacterium RIFCSPLOWO2_12_FULL_64_10]